MHQITGGEGNAPEMQNNGNKEEGKGKEEEPEAGNKPETQDKNQKCRITETRILRKKVKEEEPEAHNRKTWTSRLKMGTKKK